MTIKEIKKILAEELLNETDFEYDQICRHFECAYRFVAHHLIQNCSIPFGERHVMDLSDWIQRYARAETN